MPQPEAIAAIERFRRRLLLLDGQTSAELVQAYGPIWQRIEGDLISIAQEAVDKQLSFAQVQKLTRLQSLQRQLAGEMAEYAGIANGHISAAQRSALALAQEGTRGVVNAALPAGIDTNLLGQIGIQWNQFPAGAFESFVGIAGDGAPLSNLLAPLGAQAQAGIIQGLAEGIALGKNPRETARIIRNRFGMPLSQSLNISRTETLRAFRESTRAQYAANSDVVKGYRRLAKHDSDTCMACLARDGTFYRLDEPLNEHPSGRCALVPEVLNYADLGLDIPEDTRREETGKEWFNAQPTKTQRKMMGAAKFDAWQDAKFTLDDIPKVTTDRTWGDSATPKSLKELVG